jgi:hypothetical protein
VKRHLKPRRGRRKRRYLGLSERLALHEPLDLVVEAAMGVGYLAADGTLYLGTRRRVQELIVVLVLVSDEIEGEIFAAGVHSHEGAEGEDDIVDVEHPSGRVLIPSGSCRRECVVHLAPAAVEHKRI